MLILALQPCTKKIHYIGLKGVLWQPTYETIVLWRAIAYPTHVPNTHNPYVTKANCPKPTPTCGVHNGQVEITRSQLPCCNMMTKMDGDREV